MKHTWLVGALASVIVAGSAAAQTPYQTPSPKPTTQKPATEAKKPAGETQKPATTTQKPATEMQKPATTTRPRAAAATAEVPTGETVLGTVTIPRTVMADGKTLPSGRYTVRLTAQSAQPTVPGQLPDLNRWAEFVQGNTVRGREVVSIVPADEVDDTMPGPDMPGHVGRNQQRVEMLKGGDYLRVWINRGGHNYLIHLPPSGAAR
jgi:pyruvate/2-oxoglutarate dehydrogenase complex dihydrolipoamide acyltransferase (E2) component